MTHITKTLFLLLTAVLLVVSPAGAEDLGQTDVSAYISEVVIDADLAVSVIGYTVNGESNINRVLVMSGDEVVIRLNGVPSGKVFRLVAELDGETKILTGNPITISGFPRDRAISIPVHLSLIPAPTPSPGGGGSNPTPYVPGTPTPTPTVSPTETPGSDEPYTPILPPAGSVHSIAGLIPLAAGILLLFLVFFWKRKVYRILKHHAKQHGEKPEKELLKATADAIIRAVRSDEYAGWRKNSGLTARLSDEIRRILDEMQYPAVVPRDALVAEIIRSAKSKINRHRL